MTEKIEKSWITAQAIIVGLVIKEALVQIYENVEPIVAKTDGFIDTSAFDLTASLLYLAFFLMLVRFYLGAFRYGQIDEASGNSFSKIKDFIGACILFTFFFFMASSLNLLESFIKYVFWLHVVDGIWFFVAALHCYKNKWPKKKQISITFLIFTISTVLVLYFSSNLFFILCCLVGISIFDLLVLYPFYMRGDVKFVWDNS